MTRIEEGHFRHGKLDGFGRVMTEDGHHQVGFWKHGHPYGKLQKYRGGVLLEQGIWTYVSGKSYLEKEMKITEFLENQEPRTAYVP